MVEDTILGVDTETNKEIKAFKWLDSDPTYSLGDNDQKENQKEQVSLKEYRLQKLILIKPIIC